MIINLNHLNIALRNLVMVSTLITLGGPVVYILIILSICYSSDSFYKLHIFAKVNFFI